MKLEGRVALITGSGSGLGRAMALAFAREGADIAVADIQAAGAEETARTIAKKLRRRAIAIQADVASARDVDAMVGRTLDELGRIDILVNNAGIGQNIIPTVEQSVANWDRVTAVHMRGTFLCSRRAGEWMIRQNRGVILNISSMVGLGGFPMRTSYGAAKAGIINLTQNLAVEWAKHNIRVNCILPSYILTPFVEGFVREGKLNTAELEKRTPLGRLGTPDEIASAALFLVSDDASYITGVALPVDGGWTAYKYL